MPIYEYYCPANGQSVEVMHAMTERLADWKELCAAAGIDPGATPGNEPVERLIFPAGVSTPRTNTELKNMGFTKLVKRDTGVYENVTATGKESRYMNAGDASTMPDFSKKIKD